jgi:hypothetical protein
MAVTVLVVLVLLVLLLFGFLGLGTVTGTEPHRTTTDAPTATITQTLFSVDGKALDSRKPIRLHEGQLLRFPHGTEGVRLNRLECAHDVHRLALRNEVSWRVPDLPSGEYLLSAVILGDDFDYLVHARSHSAPCPGP